MDSLAAAVIAFALSSSDICTDPVAGDYGESPTCRAERDFRLATPFFSIDLEAGLFVGTSSGGRTIFVQDAPFDERFTMEIQLILGPWDAGQHRPECTKFSLNGAEGIRCDYSPEGDILREYILNRGMKSSSDEDISASVDFLLGEGGEAYLPQFERILETLEIMPSEQMSG